MTIQTLRAPGRLFDKMVGVVTVMLSLTLAGATVALGV